MIISTQELLLKYKGYSAPKMKIKNEVKKGTYFKVARGLYETDKKVEPYLLAGYLRSPSYLSFEYALFLYGMIPESVYIYTSATSLEKHTFEYQNMFGRYLYHDIPNNAFTRGVIHYEKDGYSYNVATKEKAICDLLAIKKPLSNKMELFSYLFDSLRIDEDVFKTIDFDETIEIAKLYKRKNLDLFIKILKDFKHGKYD